MNMTSTNSSTLSPPASPIANALAGAFAMGWVCLEATSPSAANTREISDSAHVFLTPSLSDDLILSDANKVGVYSPFEFSGAAGSKSAKKGNYSRPLSAAQNAPTNLALSAALQRIERLKADARIEDLEVSEASEEDLVAFLKAQTFTRRPSIGLLDNGNLRAVWRNSKHEQIGLQFRGDGECQYVFLSSRKDGQPMAATYGRDTVAVASKLIAALELERLIAA